MLARLIIPVAIGVGIWMLLRSSDTRAQPFNPQIDVSLPGETGVAPSMSDEEYRARLIEAGYDPAIYGFRPLDEFDAPGAAPAAAGSPLTEHYTGAQILEFPGAWHADDAPAPGQIFTPSQNSGTPMNPDQNLAAFLMTIRYAEGTAGPDGYRTMFGGELFDSFTDHPRLAITRKLGGKPITSTAAGAYQFLTTTWDEAARALGLPDFSPSSQDQAAVFLIKRRGALEDVLAGNFERAIAKLNKEWASLPGSPYGQPTKPLDDLITFYNGRGGELAA